MTNLSVNVNKVALLRNTRTIGIPSVTRAAQICVDAGAHGITVHPRPDQRHIRPSDVHDLAEILTHLVLGCVPLWFVTVGSSERQPIGPSSCGSPAIRMSTEGGGGSAIRRDDGVSGQQRRVAQPPQSQKSRTKGKTKSFMATVL